MTNINKKDCDITADIIRSTNNTYTILTKVFDKETKEPVPCGNVTITSKKGEKGTGKIKKSGKSRIVCPITRKDYKLSIMYEENDNYNSQKTEINFQKQYLFFKSMTYMWLAIIALSIVLLYITILNTMMVQTFPDSVLTKTIHDIIPYFSSVGNTYTFQSTIFYHYLIRIITWVLIISFVISGVYASMHNSNYQNIINKNVRNHFIFTNYIKLLIAILVALTIVALYCGVYY